MKPISRLSAGTSFNMYWPSLKSVESLCALVWWSGGLLPARSARAGGSTSGHGERAARIMATGRKLEKPVCHYSLNWAKDERPDRQEMSPGWRRRA